MNNLNIEQIVISDYPTNLMSVEFIGKRKILKI